MWGSVALLVGSMSACLCWDWLNPPGPCLMLESSLRARIKRGAGLFEPRRAPRPKRGAPWGAKPGSRAPEGGFAIRGARLSMILGAKPGGLPPALERGAEDLLESMRVDWAVHDGQGRWTAVHLEPEGPLDLRAILLRDAGVAAAASAPERDAFQRQQGPLVVEP